MKYKGFEQNKIFMILNCIIFLIACLILKRFPIFNYSGFLGTILFIVVILILSVVIYQVNFFIYRKIKNYKRENKYD
ncbi:hypothetical protein [Mammaliicoccus sciuri]|uniref:hypothetical protein n=1 Tax=Mammaliicoccus sciuri TaxID=1296 RepID=UPI0019586711|nr:hypothetical protein [Mammaliicoccus sciuri]